MKRTRLKKNQNQRISQTRHHAKHRKAARHAGKSKRGGARLHAGRKLGGENKVTKEGRELVHGIVDFEALVVKYYNAAMRGKVGPTKVALFNTLMAYGFGKPPQAIRVNPTPRAVNVFFHDVE
jgi:hypothetical protein